MLIIPHPLHRPQDALVNKLDRLGGHLVPRLASRVGPVHRTGSAPKMSQPMTRRRAESSSTMVALATHDQPLQTS